MIEKKILFKDIRGKVTKVCGNCGTGAGELKAVEDFAVTQHEEIERLKELLIASLEWVEHDQPYVNDSFRYCQVKEKGCLKCKIHKELGVE